VIVCAWPSALGAPAFLRMLGSPPARSNSVPDRRATTSDKKELIVIDPLLAFALLTGHPLGDFIRRLAILVSVLVWPPAETDELGPALLLILVLAVEPAGHVRHPRHTAGVVAALALLVARELGKEAEAGDDSGDGGLDERVVQRHPRGGRGRRRDRRLAVVRLLNREADLFPPQRIGVGPVGADDFACGRARGNERGRGGRWAVSDAAFERSF
jgi:hypothetical protein